MEKIKNITDVKFDEKGDYFLEPNLVNGDNCDGDDDDDDDYDDDESVYQEPGKNTSNPAAKPTVAAAGAGNPSQDPKNNVMEVEKIIAANPGGIITNPENFV